MQSIVCGEDLVLSFGTTRANHLIELDMINSMRSVVPDIGKQRDYSVVYGPVGIEQAYALGAADHLPLSMGATPI